MALDPTLRDLAQQPNFAALTTLSSSGQPSTHVMWVGADDEHLLINTEVHRQKFKNVQNDPRVAVTVWRAESPYQYVEARGRVVEVITGEEARRHIDELAQRYTGGDYANPIESERALLKIAVHKVHRNGL